jgi:hypothetical protein
MALAAVAHTTRRDRIVLVVSSVLLAVTIVEWSAGQWVS